MARTLRCFDRVIYNDKVMRLYKTITYLSHYNNIYCKDFEIFIECHFTKNFYICNYDLLRILQSFGSNIRSYSIYSIYKYYFFIIES